MRKRKTYANEPQPVVTVDAQDAIRENNRALMGMLSPDGMTKLQGHQLAQVQTMVNVYAKYQECLANIGRFEADRDSNNGNGRKAYDRAHNRMRETAVRWKEVSGEAVTIPAWIAPPTTNPATKWETV